MQGKSSKSHSFGIRISNATYDEIERLIKTSIKQPAQSVSEYCANVVERHVWRHSTRKYRKPLS